MNKTQASKLSKDLNAAINAVLAEHGITAKTKLVWTADGEINFKATGKSAEAKANLVQGFSFRLGSKYKEGQTFEIAGKTFELVDYNTRARKFPWVARCLTDGKSYKLSDSQVRNAL